VTGDGFHGFVSDDILLGRSNLIPPSTVDSANDGIGKFVSIDYHVPSISDKLPTRLMNRPAPRLTAAASSCGPIWALQFFDHPEGL
jgi:hypothetical protein